MLPRILEPEVMDTALDAADYDAMDHSHVNGVFVDDFLAALAQHRPAEASAADNPAAELTIADLGAGTARIPILLCQRCADCRVMAIDAAIAMLELARYQVEVAGLGGRIQLEHADCKALPTPDAHFAAVISNSIVHHIPEPLAVLREAVRIAAPGGRLFFRDLLRPASQEELDHLVTQYAGGDNPHQRQLFADSLHAALTLTEVQALVAQLGFAPTTVSQTSDRHWTWSAVKACPP